ncbi:hypothetical protein ACROYT_G040022 [Oculina patagonica]
MHKRNIHRNTDSIRHSARASQVRLEEISDKIEREKHKIIKSSHHERAKVLTELKSIHRVFEPRLEVIKEIQERLLSAASKDDTSAQNGRNGAGGDLAESVERPRSLQGTKTQFVTSATRRRHTEPKMWRPFGERMPALANCPSQADLENPPLSPLQRSYRWCQSPNEPEGPRLSVQIEREYLAKLRNAAEKPCVSDSMSSVSMGYIAFKRALKDKRRSECLDRKFVDPRFKSVFLDSVELSTIPEDTDWIKENSDFVNSHLVKKDNREFNGRLPMPISKHHSLSSLAWPRDDLPMGSPAARRNLLKPDLLCAKNTEITALKPERRKTNQASGSIARGCSGVSEEEIFRTFDENPKKKIPFSGNRHTRLRNCAATLLRPLGTGCFSESFQAVSQVEKYK